MTAPIQTDVAIIGAGTAGIGAFAELGKLGLSRVLINHGPLGTTCARVGCMPSKAVLHAGAQWATLRTLLNGAEPPAGAQRPIDLWRHARATRDMLAGNTAKRTQSAAGDDLLMGRARFVGPSTLDVDGRRVEAKAVIVATGSGPVVPGLLKALGERVLTTDTLFDLDELPASVGMLGLGAIGLEMGLALSRLGVRVVAGDMKALPAGITDPEVGQAAIARFAPELTMWLGQPMQAKADGKRITVSAGDGRSETVDMVLAALGRSPNLDGLDLAAAGVPLDDKGRPQLSDDGLRAGDAPVVFAGDVNGVRPLMHEAVDEGLFSARLAAHIVDGRAIEQPQRRVPLAIVFSDPDIGAVGMAHDQLDAGSTVIGTAKGSANGRAQVLGAPDDLIRVYADARSGRLLGASLITSHGEHLSHLLAWAIQRGETAQQLLELPYYHPTLEELLQSALKDVARQVKG
ncbi:MAG: dihydrolipoyl dehydrogenase [Alicycliphilus sp.]|nr:dihydrolipoyl dehydrogenase [Alicycliphilus sp.]MBP7536959.1 dihydrolipoyl dehydrogenase [Ottowia sp.]MBP9953544.1 dihydrolipoyl dehydrogenase [Ottowia sp.]